MIALLCVATVSAVPSGSSALERTSAPVSACTGTPADAVLVAQIGRTRSLALSRLKAAATGRTDRFPEAAAPTATGWTRRTSGAWTAGFYPGSLWQAYGWTRDPAWLHLARTWTAGVRGQATNTTTHDLGFLIDTTAGRGSAMDPSSAARSSYARTVVTAARSLATRYNPAVGAVQSSTYDGQWGVILDSGMNMQLLFHGARLTSDAEEAARFRAVAHQHLLTLARDFVRSDGSTFHRMVYDPTSGKLLGPVAGQGANEASTWTRGQAWAIYGFAAGYRQTGDQRLLDAAREVARLWRSRIGSDCVPLWDFDAPASLQQKDSSAGAIAAAGLLGLAAVDPDPLLAQAYRSHAMAMLARLTSKDYTTVGTEHPAVLRRQSYSIPTFPHEGSYIWGDHYLLEAMTRALTVLRVTPRLSVEAPAAVSYGVRVPVVVRAMLPGGAPAARVPVTLQWLARGATSWTAVATGTTNSRGGWRLTFPPDSGLRVSGLFRVGTAGTAAAPATSGGYEPASSTGRRVNVTVTGRLHILRSFHDRYVLAMSRTAAPAGTHLALQERRGGSWVTVRTAKTTTTSTRRRYASVRYFRVLPVVRPGLRAVASDVVRLPPRAG